MRRITAGSVGRPRGLDGSFHVRAAKPRLLQAGGRVEVGGEQRTVAASAAAGRSFVVRLEGVEDRDGAIALGGLEISVAERDLPELEQGEWWAHELEGCQVVDGDAPLGDVVRLLELPSCEALEVRREDGKELLVPLVGDAIRRVDMDRRRIEVNMGFLGETSWR